MGSTPLRNRTISPGDPWQPRLLLLLTTALEVRHRLETWTPLFAQCAPLSNSTADAVGREQIGSYATWSPRNYMALPALAQQHLAARRPSTEVLGLPGLA